ncbi:MAG: tetratricopeptide repeat protein [Tepidisphaeraceae bacterium]
MADLPEGYRDVPEEDRKKANVFFDRAAAVAGSGQYEYAVELYLQGLSLDPEEVSGHQSMRDISMKRKASGGKAIGMLERMKIKTNTKDDKQNMLNSEKLLAYDPGNTDHMLGLLQSAHKAGFYDSVMWIGPIMQKANADAPKPDFAKFIILKDVYKDLRQWKLATDACHYAAMLRPDDMDLQTELKNLGAQHTMDAGNYGTARSFRDSVRDMTGQQKQMIIDKDVRTEEQMSRVIAEAQAEWEAEPEETGKLMKLVEALVKSDQPENENRAMELLQSGFERTRQFRFRLRIGEVRIKQLNRIERSMRERLRNNATDASLQEEYKKFLRERADEELREFTLAAENYPTQLEYRYQMARRMFDLGRFGEAIPVFQQSRQDPKFRVDASMWLGRAFLDAGFVDEAVDTLKAVIDEYALKGDPKSIEMTYWYGRSLEEKKEKAAALKAYSQVAQWNFNFRDVQGRIKSLRVA